MTAVTMSSIRFARLATVIGLVARLPALLILGLSLTLSATASAAEGDGYREVETDVESPEGKVLVQEFFWYGCPHCYHLEAEIEPWLEDLADDVVFERRALALGQHWLPLTQAFYAAQALDAVEETHAAVFDAIHRNDRKLADTESIADFYAEQGVDREGFLDAYNGFAVNNQIRKTGQIAEDAGMQGVPSILVDGRYLVTGRLAGGNARMVEVVDELIDRVRDEQE
ncbi:MAG: thiol:disulfide interchange protein DsbA/DsbL [Guyparkeria sp.]|uniref:thiol:disulfide interchange protein DsbA/DsbL n=1 Tax=Guyparkeria sp. TaxID=2035736 RepID=UPI00397C22F0